MTDYGDFQRHVGKVKSVSETLAKQGWGGPAFDLLDVINYMNEQYALVLQLQNEVLRLRDAAAAGGGGMSSSVSGGCPLVGLDASHPRLGVASPKDGPA